MSQVRRRLNRFGFPTISSLHCALRAIPILRGLKTRAFGNLLDHGDRRFPSSALFPSHDTCAVLTHLAQLIPGICLLKDIQAVIQKDPPNCDL